MLKKCISILLASVMVFTCGMVANAQTAELVTQSAEAISIEQTLQPRSEYIPNNEANLIISNGNAYCNVVVEGKKTLVYRVDITMTLQKKSLLWWSDVETWSSTTYDYKAAMSKTISVGSGTYRVKAVCTVHFSAEEESATIYSSNVSV